MKTATALLLLALPFGAAACRRETAQKPDRATAAVPVADASRPSRAPIPPSRPSSDGPATDAAAPARPAVQPIDRTPQCTRQPLPADVPALPDGVLLQSLVVTKKGVETGLRIHEDGRLEALSLGQEWAVGKVLPPDQLRTVRQAVADAQLAKVAAYHRAVVPREGMGVNWLEVRDGGAVVVAAMDDACFVPEVDALMVKLVRMFD